MWQQSGRKAWLAAAQRLPIMAMVVTGACTARISGPDGGVAAASGGGSACAGAACAGASGTGAAGGTGLPPAAAAPPMRRLNNAEYAYTVRDLFGSAGPSVVFPEEGRSEGYDTLSTALAVSPLHIQAYLANAGTLASELLGTGLASPDAAACDYSSAESAGSLTCAKGIVSDIASRAFRRAHAAWPDGQAEAEYHALLEPADPLGAFSLAQRLQSALEAVLVSPRFLFRVEHADAAGNLDTPTLASRLSYLLWSSAPDAELLSSDLQQPAVIDAQLRRLQQSPHFERFLERFPRLWLELEKLDTVERDPQVYPAYSPELLAAMNLETLRFFASHVRDPNASLSDLLLAPPPAADHPALASLYAGSPRLGMMTQASILTVTGASNRTTPVRRGKWVLERLLCAPPPPPPDGLIAELTEDLETDTTLTERERLERHRVNPSCAACHALMDPIGLGFENYDSIGAYRNNDQSGKPIDATGQLPGGAAFTNPLELVQILARDPRLQACVAQQLLTYGTGRSYTTEDAPLLERVVAAAGGAQASFASVLSSVVRSDGFRRRN